MSVWALPVSVTTDTVPGKTCESVGAQFPVVALPKALAHIQPMKNIADAAGANAVVGLRTSAFGWRRRLSLSSLPPGGSRRC